MLDDGNPAPPENLEPNIPPDAENAGRLKKMVAELPGSGETDETVSVRDRAVKETDFRIERADSLKSALKLTESREISDEQIAAALAKQLGREEKGWLPTVQFLRSSKELFPEENFPVDRREKITCDLAEIVASNHLSPEGLMMLVNQVRSRASSGEISEVAGYQATAEYRPGSDDKRGITVGDKLFETDEQGKLKLDVNHTIKHEVSHGLVKHGGVFVAEKQAVSAHIRGEEQELAGAVAQVAAILESAKTENGRLVGLQSELVQNVFTTLTQLEKNGENDPLFLKAKGKYPEMTIEAYMNIRRMQAAEEILTDKVGVYLGSEGSFSDFIRVSLEKSPDGILTHLGLENEEDQRAFRADVGRMSAAKDEAGKAAIIVGMKGKWSGLNEYIDHNRVFYDQIRKEMASSEPTIEEKIEASIEEYDDDDDIYSDIGDMQSSLPMAQNSNRGPQASNNDLIALAKAFAEGWSQETDIIKPEPAKGL